MLSELLLHPKTLARTESFLAEPSHALLITGPYGAGKTALASVIAETILKTDNLSIHPYFRRIDASDGEGIGQVREIRTFLRLKTTGEGDIRRVVIIERLDSLSDAAQNAVLKTLEEPPRDTVILLTATDRSTLLETIISRVSTLEILPIPKAIIDDTPAAIRAFGLAGGYAGAYVALLAGDEDHIIAKSVAQAKGYLTASPFERLAQVDKLAKDRPAAIILLDGLEKCLHAALKASKPSNLSAIHKKLVLVSHMKLQIHNSVNAKLLLTSLAIHL